MLTELIISLAILAIISTGVYMSVNTFRHVNHYHHARQRCLAASQGQLDSLTVRGEPLSDEQIARMWPGVTVTVEETAGQGQWQGMKLINVTAQTDTIGKAVKIQQRRYCKMD